MKKRNEEKFQSRSDELNDIFNNLSEKKKRLVFPLVENAIFIEEQLKELQEIIKRDGVIDEYKNGNNQYGKKQSATMQTYNALIKNYNSIISKLSSMVMEYIPNKESPLEVLIRALEKESEIKDYDEDLL